MAKASAQWQNFRILSIKYDAFCLLNGQKSSYKFILFLLTLSTYKHSKLRNVSCWSMKSNFTNAECKKGLIISGRYFIIPIIVSALVAVMPTREVLSSNACGMCMCVDTERRTTHRRRYRRRRRCRRRRRRRGCCCFWEERSLARKLVHRLNAQWSEFQEFQNC